MKRFLRRSKQRNYKRNKDIIYESTITKNDSNITYSISPYNNEDLYLDENILLHKWYSIETDGSNERIRPFSYITMEVDNEMILSAEIPNWILDAEFKIDNNGNLILIYG